MTRFFRWLFDVDSMDRYQRELFNLPEPRP